ncbi:MAG: SUMF1/EgtB/PvdO family nonheme iron enzyme, partial [Planctomycetota bacterium]
MPEATSDPGQAAEPAAPTLPRLCPRCGVRLGEVYKFCPYCAYRLRPDLEPAGPALPPVGPATSTGGRLVALGGSLAFVSLLLLVLLAGIELFVRTDVHTRTFDLGPLRDPDALPLGPSSFVRIPAGETYWGAYVLADPATGAEEVMPDPIWVDDPFEICVHEITNDQYFEFLVARGRRSGRPTPEGWLPGHWDRNSNRRDVPWIYPRGAANLPVTNVRFSQALEFCGWAWEELFGSDPDLVVDLPTDLEFVQAGRGDDPQRNWPWGMRFEDGTTNLPGPALAPVADASRVGLYDGIYALVGNAAEWVHGPGQSTLAAGHSFIPSELERILAKDHTPFWDAGFETRYPGAGPHEDVGFRPVVRRAAWRPVFVSVPAGPVRLGEPPLNHVVLRGVPSQVHEFEIARTAITNRQYLAFLVARSQELSAGDLRGLLPGSFVSEAGTDLQVAVRGNPATSRTVFRGIYGERRFIPGVYAAGQENLPVTGILLRHAEAYAEWLTGELEDPNSQCSLPTVAQYLRAGRRGGVHLYPWGDDPNQLTLNCWEYSVGRPVGAARPISLVGRHPRLAGEIAGLVGNAQEYVLAAGEPRVLLAGGCYGLPAEYCTLDSFVVATRAPDPDEPPRSADDVPSVQLWLPKSLYGGEERPEPELRRAVWLTTSVEGQRVFPLPFEEEGESPVEYPVLTRKTALYADGRPLAVASVDTNGRTVTAAAAPPAGSRITADYEFLTSQLTRWRLRTLYRAFAS